MTLHLTSCEPRHESGFSRGECLELMRKLSDTDIMTGYFPPSDPEDIDEALSRAEQELIVAALRAYAR